ncbi:hypothetical protein [Sulfitobacter sp. PS-8MA]|uniref:hypothetical protein n=1 Tax=Sulfitobacter sp. PS-8MA TaxID=3237707 RepID=UPI0034C626A9
MTEKRNEPARDCLGRFCNAGAYRVSPAGQPTEFTRAADARQQLWSALEQADRVLKEPPEGKGVPGVVIRASPGAGKSTLQREFMAVREAEGLGARVAFHVPTLALAEDATQEAIGMGMSAQAIRGRSALKPDGSGPMCAKAALVEQAYRIGISAREHFCESVSDDGTMRRCPHFEGCAYLAQFKQEASCHFLATAYFSLPKQPGVDPELRVVDETFWQNFLWIKDVDVVTFKSPRAFLEESDAEGHLTLLKAAAEVVSMLGAGRSLPELPYTAEDYATFAELERKGQAPASDIRPDDAPAAQKAKLTKAAGQHRQVSRLAAVWEVLQEAAEKKLASTERLRLFIQGQKEVLRVARKRPLRHKEPLLILDADADSEILTGLGCDIRMEHHLTLRPNAHVVQIHDHHMSNTSLLGSKALREECRRLIAKEVLRDRLTQNAGVLVGAPRSVVQRVFEDGGYDFSAMSDDEASQIMLTTKLHGADWLWFGGRALGSNRYKDRGSVIVLGRQELRVSDLEDLGRALWGDTPGEPLTLVTPDLSGAQRLPLAEMPYEMVDGTGMAVRAPCHPDHRIRRLQLQTRELATRQLVERLRLAHAPYRKRVILACNLPIPGLPVDELVSWQDLVGCRVEAAIVTSLTDHGMVGGTQKRLAGGAPSIFNNSNALSKYLSRNEGPSRRFEQLKKLAKSFGGSLKIKDCQRRAGQAEAHWSFDAVIFGGFAAHVGGLPLGGRSDPT